MHNHLSKLRVSNQELYSKHLKGHLPIIYTLLGVCKENTIHKAKVGALTDEGIEIATLLLLKEGQYLIDLAKAAKDFDFKIFIHTFDGTLLADMSDIKDIYACYKEAYEEVGFGTPSPLIERANKPTSPFNPKNLKFPVYINIKHKVMMTRHNPLEVITRAASIYYQYRMPFGLERTLKKWLIKKDLPYNINGAEYTPDKVTIHLISRDPNYPPVNFSFKLRVYGLR